MTSNNLINNNLIRKANLSDVKEIHKILQVYGQRGELLPRPLSKLYDHLRDFWVFEQDNNIIGCCALQFCWEDLAEIRSLAVLPDYTKRKIGSKLLEEALKEAKELNIKHVFTLTYRASFFKKFGFVETQMAKLPLKIWSDCVLCVKFPACDETPMIKEL